MLDNLINILIGMFGIILMNGSALPQIYKTFKTKSVGDLTLAREAMLLIGVLFYWTYGFLRKDIVILVSNTWAAIMFITMIIMYLKYK